MPGSLNTVLAALDALDAPLVAFVRDDDAGWEDLKLFALVELALDAGVPLDLAAIPLATTPSLAKALARRIDAAPALLGVHQHGCAHANHQREGRKCEFGDARDATRQRADLSGGRWLLQQAFGERLQPIFTPPWNRCSAQTPALLAELGYAALSRDRGAAPQSALPEIAVDVDWSRHWREGGAEAVAAALARAIAARGTDGAPLGLMLHHAAMGDDEFALLRGWYAALARHPHIQWRPMGCLIREDVS